MFSRAWWTATAERVLSTGAAALLALLTASGVTDVTHLDASAIATVTGTAMLVSFLKAMIASKTGDSEAPSFANEVFASDVTGSDSVD